MSILHRTKIVATIGPASNSPEVIKQLIEAGLNVARLNFSHGSYEDHAHTVSLLRSISKELNTPVTILQDLQGPKIRVGQLSDGAITLEEGAQLTLVPLANNIHQPGIVGIDYPYLAEEAKRGTQVLLDDGLLELQVESVERNAVICKVITGGLLKSRKGVNLPSLNLLLPSMTQKDKKDLEFGLSQGVDWISLSFVRSAEDIVSLKSILKEKSADVPDDGKNRKATSDR
uniref:pyruvate kinase n=1 Tax=Okeania sp. SIO2F4 TaxID=2607790 RepID=UPI0025F2C953|nr:pyruvate kinase [Okeania sp. SIO2F4]